MAGRGNNWLGGVALGLAALAVAVFVLTGLALSASSHLDLRPVGRSLPHLVSATVSVAALGWASWAR